MTQLTINHFMTEYTGQEPRRVWQVMRGGMPDTRELHSEAEAIRAVVAAVRGVFGPLRESLVTKGWRDGREVWSVTLCDGTNNWAESQIELPL